MTKASPAMNTTRAEFIKLVNYRDKNELHFNKPESLSPKDDPYQCKLASGS